MMKSLIVFTTGTTFKRRTFQTRSRDSLKDLTVNHLKSLIVYRPFSYFVFPEWHGDIEENKNSIPLMCHSACNKREPQRMISANVLGFII